MQRIYVPAQGASDWKRLLADPDLHWKTGRSARTLANCWHDTNGFPSSVTTAFGGADLDLELLLALPEHHVPLPGGARPSQTDLFVLARDQTGALVTIAIEGKAGEAFGPIVREWLADDQGGKMKRLSFLLEMLGVPQDPLPATLRYQLLHRAASALIEAGRFSAGQAMMLIHSFGDDHGGFADFQQFANALGVEAARDRIVMAATSTAVPLFIGWVDGETAYLES